MARFSCAEWTPIKCNFDKSGMGRILGVVFHVMQGVLDGTTAWFNNPGAKASAHFGIGKTGRILQYVDTADKAWAEVNGNSSWISIEFEGHAGDSLTPEQIRAAALVIAEAHRIHGVPLQLTDNVNTPGIGWHGMGGNAWGGHFGCPGDPIKNQRAAVIAAATSLGAPSTPAASSSPVSVIKEDDMSITTTFISVPALDNTSHGWVLLNGANGMPAVPFNKLIAITPQGSAPQRDGYWPLPKLGVNNTAGFVEVEIEHEVPKGLGFYVTYQA